MTDYELQELMTRRQRAQGLQQTETPQGRMVGRVFVNANPLEYLAAGLRRKAGTAQDEAIGGEINQLRTKREGMDADAMAKFAAALRGEPARDIQPATPMDDEGNMMPVARKEAVAPDSMAGYSALMGAYNPQLRQAGMQGMAQIPQMQEQRQFQRDQLAAQNQAKLEAAQMAQQAKAEQMAIAHQQRMDMLASQNASREQMAQAQREHQIQMQRQAQEFQRGMSQLVAASKPSEPLEQVMGDDGKPVLMPRSQAAGKSPFIASASKDKPLTESQAKGALYLGQMRSATAELDKQPSVSPVATAATGSTFTNWAAPKEAQKVAQLQNQWAEAYLRAKTGAAATQGEVDLNRRTFFPVVGDSSAVITQKKQMREQAERDMEFTAGSAAKIAGQPSPSTQKTVKRTGTLNGRKVVEYTDGTTEYVN